MPGSDEPGDRASSGGSSMCAGIARIADAADQTAEPERHNRGISHVWSSYMRITPNTALLSDGRTAFCTLSINRISLPIPKLRPQVWGVGDRAGAANGTCRSRLPNIVKAIRELATPPEPKPRRRIGFISDD